MSEFEQMKTILQNTGLYRVTEGSLIGAELKAYAAGLDLCFGELEELERECFVATARDEGLTMREDLLSRMNFDTTLSGRRQRLLKAMSVTVDDFTAEGMEKIRDSFNAHGSFAFDISTMTLTFACTDTMTSRQRQRLQQQMEPLMPCWVTFRVVQQAE